MMIMKELGKLASLERFWVRNFKSLKRFELDVSSKLMIIAGANGSGKTALVEVFELLTYMLDWVRGLIPNPFSKWWGYSNVVSGHDEDLPITIGFRFRLNNMVEKMQKIESDFVKVVIKDFRDYLKSMDIKYEIDVTGREIDIISRAGRRGFQILRENLSISAEDLEVEIDTKRNIAKVSMNIIKWAKELWEKKYKTFPHIIHMRLMKLAAKSKLKYENLETIIPLLSNLAEIFTITHTYAELTCEMKHAYSLLNHFADLERDIKLGVDREFYAKQKIYINKIKDNILGKRCIEHMAKLIGKKILVNTKSPKYQELISKWREEDIHDLLGLVKDNIARLIAKDILDYISNSVFIAIAAVYGIIDGITVIKNIDWKSVLTPQHLERQERLKPDASNFLQFLFTLTSGKIGENLEEALRYSFPSYKDFKAVFEVTTDGRVFIRLYADGLELAPISIPHGVLKTLIVESILMWKPTILVIDEFENSLYPELQQFLIDEFRNSDVYVIITTHSTIPLDYAKNIEEVVILRLENGETRAYRPGREVLEMLRRKKLTLSELILSDLLELRTSR
jgi:predicted ATPase